MTSRPVCYRPILTGLVMGTFLLSGQAAADTTAPLYDWSGVYIGTEIGGSWSETDWRFQNANYWNTLGPLVLGTDFDIDPDGLTGGVLGGYNYQLGAFVAGVEVSLLRSVSGEAPSPFFPDFDEYTADIDWIATVSARLGYAAGPWLFYGKAGWASGDVGLRLYEPNTQILSTAQDWANGWSWGLGFDYAVTSDLRLGVAYTHVSLDIDSATGDCPGCGSGVGFGAPVTAGDAKINTVTLRISLALGQP